MNKARHIESWPSRMTLKEKLGVLQISEEAFKFYYGIFVTHWMRYMIKKGDEEWQVIKSNTGKLVKLTEHVVAYHLLGKYWAATFASEVPRYLCIDIDRSPNLLIVYKDVIRWIPHPLVFRSSESGGLHVYAFIDPPIRTNKLVSITQMELKIRGVTIAPGICEVYPSPNKYLRLPLGKGSCLLDPKTLTRMDLSLGESIRFIKNNLYRHTFEELFPGLYRRMGRHNVNF